MVGVCGSASVSVRGRTSAQSYSGTPDCDLVSYISFFFNDTATTKIYTRPYTLSLHDALPISAALLTIIGYSVNDTIVAYDRLRENRGKTTVRGRPFAEQMNDAVNQTLSRTVLTALTVFLSTAILLFFGGKTLEDFAFVLFVGVITGTYSNTYVAAALVVDWTLYVEGRLVARKKRVAKAGEARKIT